MKTAEAVRPVLLLVDDDPAILSALEAELTPRFGGLCRIETFERPQDVVQALDQWAAEGRSVALAIVDQRMPGLTGIELVRKMRESARESAAATGAPRFSPAAATRTVLLTGFGGPGVEAAARAEGGVSRYREKPWSREQLSNDVGALLGEFWTAAQRESHQAYRDFVSTSELRTLWSQLMLVDPARTGSAASSGPVAEVSISEAVWALLRAAVRDQQSDERPSEEALTAFLLGEPTDEQRAQVRRAALASTAFRHELIQQMSQLGRLENFETRMAFDQVNVPDWVRRLGERGGA